MISAYCSTTRVRQAIESECVLPGYPIYAAVSRQVLARRLVKDTVGPCPVAKSASRSRRSKSLPSALWSFNTFHQPNNTSNLHSKSPTTKNTTSFVTQQARTATANLLYVHTNREPQIAWYGQHHYEQNPAPTPPTIFSQSLRVLSTSEGAGSKHSHDRVLPVALALQFDAVLHYRARAKEMPAKQG